MDAAYMAAAAAFSRHLGWPLTVFTTPEGRPFYAGTYFPPEPRSGLPSFTQVLGAVTEAWTDRREQVDGTADAVASALAETQAAASVEKALPSVDDIARAAAAIEAREDREFGGFGGGDPAAPKFPIATALRFLQSGAVRDREPRGLGRRRSRARRDGRLGAPRPGRRRLLPLRHAPRLDRAALRADADRQRAAARGRDRCRRRADRTRHRPLPHRRAAAAVRRVRRRAGLGVVDRRRAQRGRLLREGCREPAPTSTLRPSTARSSPGGTASRSARSRAPAHVSTSRRGSRRRGGRRKRCSARTSDRTAGSCAHRSTRSPRPRRRRLADYGQLASGLVALAVATGEVAYAERARDLVLACIDADGAPRVPGGGDPVLAAQGIAAPDAASDGDEPSGPSALADAAVSLWLLGATGRTARRRGADRRRARGRRARAAARVRGAAARRGGTRGAAPAARRGRRGRGRARWWRRRAASRATSSRSSPPRRPRSGRARASRCSPRRARRAAARRPTTAGTSPAACRSPTLPS